jgi:hypothetical protein
VRIEEVPVGRLIGILLVVWLVIGGVAAFQRGYLEDTRTNCSEAGDIALTVVAGPLNYFGVNPKVKCSDVDIPDVDVPEPSN